MFPTNVLGLKLSMVKKLEPRTCLHSFTEIVKKLRRKPNKLWVDQRREFYNSLRQK